MQHNQPIKHNIMSQQLTLHLQLTEIDHATTLKQTLLNKLRDYDGIEQAGLENKTRTDGAKGAWGDWLKLKFTPENLENVFAFIANHLPGQPMIELALENPKNGKQLKLKVRVKDFEIAMQQANDFLNQD